MDDSLLWVYEGLTSFWDDILATRAGLLSEEQYRDEIAGTMATFRNSSGTDWRPLADTAVAAANLYDAPQDWRSSRRGTDFYAASVFLWLDVDSEIRARTDGEATLDDFMRVFYAGSSGQPALKPYTEQDIYDTLSQVAPGEWRALVRRHPDETGTAALQGALERSGWQLIYTGQHNVWLEFEQKRRKTTDRMWSIGMRLDENGQILDVVENRAAARAGAGPGMTVVAVNGRKYTTEVLDAEIDAAKDSRDAIELLVLNNDFYRTPDVEYFDGQRFAHLARIDGTNDTLTEVLASRAAGP